MKRAAMLSAVFAAVMLAATACSSATKGSTTSGANAASPVIHGVLGVIQTPLGSVLTDMHGMTVYRFAPDPQGRSTCVASCLKYWPAVPAPTASGAAGSASSVPGLSARIGSVQRPDGSRQLAVDGYPVYTYVGDKSAGDTAGQGLNTSGGLWWVLGPSGAEITHVAASTGSSATPGSSSPVRYGGGY